VEYNYLTSWKNLEIFVGLKQWEPREKAAATLLSMLTI